MPVGKRNRKVGNKQQEEKIKLVYHDSVEGPLLRKIVIAKSRKSV